MLIIYHQIHLFIYSHNAAIDALQIAMTPGVYSTLKTKIIHKEVMEKKESTGKEIGGKGRGENENILLFF